MKLARIAVDRPVTYWTFAVMLCMCGLLYTQEIIENPGKPSTRDAGRVLKLKEIWRITDDGGEFYFRNPRSLQVADDGSIFLAESEQFLKFSPDGKFLKNLYKKGQGPGEIGDYFYYDLHGSELFIQDMNSQRFWRADLDGRFQGQISLADKDLRGFAGGLADGFLFLKTVWPQPEERTGKLMEILETVVLFARDGSGPRDIAAFRPRRFLAPQAAMAWDPSITKPSPDGRRLYAVHSRDYMIEVVDISSGATIRKFRRQYPKVPYAEQGWEPDFRKKFGAPKIEYEIDISDIFPSGEHLWVQTSTDDKAKGRLFDVFDADGQFIDSFYLGLGRTLLAAHGTAVFTLEKNEDDSLVIVKYRVDK